VAELHLLSYLHKDRSILTEAAILHRNFL